jgi:prevent-host-death family protein
MVETNSKSPGRRYGRRQGRQEGNRSVMLSHLPPQGYILTIKVVTMKPIQVAEDILPIATFKARASEVVRSIRSRGRPMIITQNGQPAAVLISPEDFDRLTYRERFRSAVGQRLADADAGRVVSDHDLDEDLDAELGKRTK